MKNWLQPPRLRIDEDSEEERRATWLELFYDLVFVVAISQLAHNLHEHVSWAGFLGFVFLFVPVWWAWIGTTFYANRFDTDELGHRLLTVVQMMAIAALAVNVHHGLGDTSVGFAVSYTVARAVLVLEYFRAAKHIPVARPLINRYATGFAIAASFWLISTVVPIPLRFILWGLGIMVDFVTPIAAGKLQLGLPPHASHLPERFGLFTMIVLGEAIIAVVNGVSEQHWDVASAIAAGFGFIIAFSLWWVYFDNLGGIPIQTARQEGRNSSIWLYTHLPLVIGIAAAGVGVEQVLLNEHSEALTDAGRWLICGAVALCFLSLGILHRTGVIRYCKIRFKYRIGGAIVLLVLAIVGRGLLPIAVIGLIALVCAVQVVQDVTQSRPTTRLSDPEF